MVRGDIINDNSFAVGLESFDGDLFDVHGVCEWGGGGRERDWKVVCLAVDSSVNY